MRKCGLVLLAILLVGCKTEQAAAPIERVAQHNPKAATVNVDLGYGYLKRGNYQRSHSKFLLALQQNPNDPVVHTGLAFYFQTTGQPDKAKRYFLQAIKIAPNTGSVHNNYGTFLCSQGQYKAAISEFETAISISSYVRDGQALENAGLCAMKMPDMALAKSYFKKALMRDPKLVVSRQELERYGG